MQVGVFVPINNNGWLISENAPQYMPSFDLNKADRPEGREARARFPALDDQAARLRRQDPVLGIRPGELHPDGGARRGHRADQDLRDLPDAGHPAGLRRADVQHDRLHQPRPVRAQPDHRLAAARVQPDGPVAGRRAFPQPLPDARRIRPDPARAVGDRASRLQGRVLPDGRLPRPAHARRRHEDHLRRLVGRGPRLLGQVGGLRLLPRQGRQHARRPSPATTSGWPRRPPRPGATSRSSSWS